MPIIEDAFVGALVGQLLTTVLEMKEKAVKFRPTLEKLQGTLENLQTDANLIEEQIRRLNRPEAQTATMRELLEKGRKLVLECSKESWWWWNCFFKKVHYQEQLEALDQSIVRYFQVEFQLKIFTYGVEAAAGIEKLREELKNAFVFSRNDENNEVRSVCAPPKPPLFTVGLDAHLNELKRKLCLEEVSVSVSVHTVTGFGGVGKTTLARKFCWDQQVKGKFKQNIFYFTFGKRPKLNTIVQNLLLQLPDELKSIKDDAKPAVGCEYSGLNKKDYVSLLKTLLNKMGKKGPMLLVLDDVQVGSESLFDSFVLPIPEYKILVTSRSPIARFGTPPHSLEPLGEADAAKLFCNSASLNQSTSDISLVVKKVVRGCCGSPLALTVTGKSLCHQKLVIWRNMANEFSMGYYYYRNIGICLQKSLDVLDPKAIECFKDLSLFPENQRIPVAALVDMWAQLHCEDDVSALEKVYQLVNMNMIDITVTGKFASDTVNYNHHYVIQDSLLRELADLQTRREPEDKRNRLTIEINGNNIPAKNKYPIATRILSISIDEAFSSNWCNSQQLTEVEGLVLNLQGKKCKLPIFIKKMNKVKVCIITNYDFFHVELENLELLDHLSDLKRLRVEKVSIPCLSKTGARLKNLKKCSFFMCHVNEAFENCTAQVSEMLPNLVEMNFDYCTMVELPISLSNSVLLNKLRITNCHKLSALPDGIGELVYLKSLRLSSCTSLLKLPGSITKLQSLQSLDISYCINLSELPNDIGKLRNLEKLNVRGCFRLTQLPPSIEDLCSLKNVACDEETARMLWEPVKERLSDLHLHVAKADFNFDFL